MTNAQKNKAFLNAIDAKSRMAILSKIANHYGITNSEALEEVSCDESEHLLDYMTGKDRTATSVLMQRHGLA